MRKYIPVHVHSDGRREFMELEGEMSADEWEVFTWEKNGVMERSARPVVHWTELGIRVMEPEVLTEEQIAEKKERSLRASARRAKTTCRRKIITAGFNEVLTLTYRENQQDRDLAVRHFQAWARRMRKALGTFEYCGSIEPQERGAYHFHISTHKLPSHAHYKGVKVKAWELGTRIWRDVVGADNGLCFVGASTKNGGGVRRKKLSLAKMAAYVSKYILKDFDQAPENAKRYFCSLGIEPGACHKMRLKCSFLDLVVLTFEQLPGASVIAHRIGKFGDSLWLCTESPPIGQG